MITFWSKQTHIVLLIFVSLLPGLILALWPKPSFVADRPFAGAGRAHAGNRKGSGPGRRDSQWRNSQ